MKKFRNAPLLILFIIGLLLSACKKQLVVDDEKIYHQANFKFDPSMPFNGGWQVTLQPNGNAVILPGGDIMYNGNYKIKGKSLSIKTTDGQKFEFEIISPTEIKDKTYAVYLILSQ
jgi:hypothetical protein